MVLKFFHNETIIINLEYNIMQLQNLGKQLLLFLSFVLNASMSMVLEFNVILMHSYNMI